MTPAPNGDMQACHLELSGLTDPGEMCSCGLPAGMHAKWKHRPKSEGLYEHNGAPRPYVPCAFTLVPESELQSLRTALDEEIIEHSRTRHELELVAPRTVERASTSDLIWALGERLVRRFL